MPFGLKNVGVTFQREDHVFKDFIGNFMGDYQDDLTIHSKLREEHIKHLRQVFEHYKMYGISLNHKKCLFAVS
jgi:hypothetical protein